MNHEIKQLSNQLWKNLWRENFPFGFPFVVALRSLWFSAIVRRFREDGTSALPSEPTTEKWSSKKPSKVTGKSLEGQLTSFLLWLQQYCSSFRSFGVETPQTFCHFPKSWNRERKNHNLCDFRAVFLKWLTSFLSLHLRSRPSSDKKHTGCPNKFWQSNISTFIKIYKIVFFKSCWRENWDFFKVTFKHCAIIYEEQEIEIHNVH